MKKILIISVSLLMVFSLTGCGCNKKNKKEDIKVNTNKNVIKDQKVDGIKMTNTSLVTTNGISRLVTSVTNPTKEDYKLDEYMIIIKDKEGKVIIKVPGYVGDTIKAGESRTINTRIDIDLSSAYSVEYEVKK